MKRLLPLALLAASPALAETDVSALIAAQGLRAAQAQLAALPAPTASERFALGGVHFLGGVERALQTRWRTGLSDGLVTLVDLPILRLPIAENPAPEPFQGAIITDLFAGVAADMAGAIPLLEGIGNDDLVGLTINTRDIWFDIDMDGSRSAGEGLGEVMGLNGGFNTDLPEITVRFDTADAAWLAAYAHLLAGLADLVVAFDPATAIDDTLVARDAMDALNAGVGQPFGAGFGYEFGDYADLALIVVDALERQPDPALTRSAQTHWLATIAQNRIFWQRVATETDNADEWIPNKSQVSALGLPFPPETGQRWLNVLKDAEDMLTGQTLLPHWRLAAGAGIDLNALLQDPPVVDVLGMAHGAVLVPYMRPGRLIDGNSLRQFEQLLSGNAGLYMVILN